MRGKRASKRKIQPDLKYRNITVAKLINYVMQDGKKITALKVVYQALDLVKERTEHEPVEVLEAALKNITPTLEVRSRRVGGATYQVPIPVRKERQLALAFRWMLEAARAKKAKPMHEKLANELVAAANGEGDAVKKKADVQRMAEANRAFAHFARF
jgi:small subunit ribosomal protein S7